MTDFKAGDEVVCINKGDAGCLRIGQVYTINAVEKYRTASIILNGITGQYHPSRFKLAKGAENMNTKTNPFKVGDTVVFNGNDSHYLSKGFLYVVSGVAGCDISVVGFNSWYHASSFTLHKSDSFNKDQLKVGMRVVIRDGRTLAVGPSFFYDKDGNGIVATCYYRGDLLRANGETRNGDVMEVWGGTELAADFFDMDKKGALLFKRVEKTAEDLKKEAQLKDIAELEARLADLKSKINS